MNIYGIRLNVEIEVQAKDGKEAKKIAEHIKQVLAKTLDDRLGLIGQVDIEYIAY